MFCSDGTTLTESLYLNLSSGMVDRFRAHVGETCCVQSDAFSIFSAPERPIPSFANVIEPHLIKSKNKLNQKENIDFAIS